MAFLDQLDLASQLHNDRVACSLSMTTHGIQAALTRGLDQHLRLWLELHVGILRCSKLLVSTSPWTTTFAHMARLATGLAQALSHHDHLWQALLPPYVQRGRLALRRLDPLRLAPLSTGSTWM